MRDFAQTYEKRIGNVLRHCTQAKIRPNPLALMCEVQAAQGESAEYGVSQSIDGSECDDFNGEDEADIS